MIISIRSGVPILPKIEAARSPRIRDKGMAMPASTTTNRWLGQRLLLLSWSLAAALTLSMCGCTTSLSEWIHNGFKVGPNFEPPPAPLPPQWIDANNTRVHVGDPNLCTWWDVFDDPILTRLLYESYANNLTQRAAAIHILEARELQAIALGELLPQSQSFLLQYTRSMASATGGSPASPGPTFGTGLSPSTGLAAVSVPSTPIAGAVDPGTGTTTTTTNNSVNGTSVGVGGSGPRRFFSNIATSLNASWELDFWGLFRRNLESADASLDQTVADYDEMLVLLLSEVATKYVEIRTLQRRLELARSNVALQEPLVEAYRKRYQLGIAVSFPGYFQLLANLENTKALIPVLEISLRQFNNQLCVLLGQPVHDMLPDLGDGTGPDPADPKKRIVRIPQPRDYSVVVGIPGDFLLRRPDIQAARDQLRIQSAQIGIAEAEMYPHIGVNGNIGLASGTIDKLFDSRSWVGSIGPSLTWNILNYGRLLAGVRFQNYLYLQDVATYQQAVLNANQDAENALVAYLKSIEQTEHLRNSAGAAVNVTTYLLNQYRLGFLPGGADTSAFINQIFTVINFQVTQQDLAAQAEGNIALNLILLYRAMGGGWQMRKNGTSWCTKAGLEDHGWPIAAPLEPALPPGAPAMPAADTAEKLPAPRPLPGPDPKPAPGPQK
jgi:NodT family efflux transporter outer membrane factor (OMF) lipoprotein